ncbi:pyridoxal-phosphate dependent enzyme [Streptomyces sp. NPDC093591]|uniref:pyridoxal-phosphate dependent enzyme n=1 Tax=Streptomyces sp. NPDC093591 TaxID=3366044 RepID=UPI00381511FE
MRQLAHGDIKAAADRIAGKVRPVVLSSLDAGFIASAWRDPLDDRPEQDCQVWLALEFMQHTGSFEARGAQNLIAAHRENGSLPVTGITTASGGNAGLACAWAARQQGITATVFLPTTAPATEVAKLRGYNADVRLVGAHYTDALKACQDFATTTGALLPQSHADPLISAGAGTLLEEIHKQIPSLDTIVLTAGSNGLLTGITAAAQHHGITTVTVEPEHHHALNGASHGGSFFPSDFVGAAGSRVDGRGGAVTPEGGGRWGGGSRAPAPVRPAWPHAGLSADAAESRRPPASLLP